MTTKNTFSIHFWVDKRNLKKTTDEAPIYARLTINGKRTEIAIQKSINPELWNAEKRTAKGSTENAKAVNKRIERVRNHLINLYDKMAEKRILITAEGLKNAYLGIEATQHSLMSLVAYHNNEMKDTIAPGTLKNYFTTEKYLQRFLKEKLKTSDVYLTQLNYKFVVDFEMWLKSLIPEGNRRACENNTSMKHIERLRKMINVALRNEWLDKDPFNKFRLSFQKTRRGFLTDKELYQIESLELTNKRLEKVRDLFVFSCYTGLAYIDVKNLTASNLNRDIEGNVWLYTNRQKTDITVRVPLLPQAISIIEKYQDQPDLIRDGRLLPVISNHKINIYLKEIGKLLEISKNLSFHLARHTFATTTTLTNGVPIESVSAMLGHSSIKTTQIYAKVVEKKLMEDMRNLKEKIDSRNKTNVPLCKFKDAG